MHIFTWMNKCSSGTEGLYNNIPMLWLGTHQYTFCSIRYAQGSVNTKQKNARSRYSMEANDLVTIHSPNKESIWGNCFILCRDWIPVDLLWIWHKSHQGFTCTVLMRDLLNGHLLIQGSWPTQHWERSVMHISNKPGRRKGWNGYVCGNLWQYDWSLWHCLFERNVSLRSVKWWNSLWTFTVLYWESRHQ